tara:strand:+ start:793 stop:1008 length:216 start_codon:yes stop_codon:yes gene_type:complete
MVKKWSSLLLLFFFFRKGWFFVDSRGGVGSSRRGPVVRGMSSFTAKRFSSSPKKTDIFLPLIKKRDSKTYT